MSIFRVLATTAVFLTITTESCKTSSPTKSDTEGLGDVASAARERFINESAQAMLTLTEKANSANASIRAGTQTAFLNLARTLNNRDLLRPVISASLNLGNALPGAQPVSPEAQTEKTDRMTSFIDAEFFMRGETPESQHVNYESWDQISERLFQKVNQTAFPPQQSGSPTLFDEPGFVAEFEKLTQSKFSTGNFAEILVDGPASFKVRDRLMAQASKSIHIASWAFYEDETAKEAADTLIAKHQAGVDVKVVVDGPTSFLLGYNKTLQRMAQAGVPVIRWSSKNNPYHGMHRKLTIVDGQHVICGGINFGNNYSHKGQLSDKEKWRDTDIYVKGPASQTAVRIFSEMWNQQVSEHPDLGFQPDSANTQSETFPSGPRMSFINQTPLSGELDPIYLATLKAISGATQMIDINNAYLISTPALEKALFAALARGVRVRIFTNSAESIDEPIVMRPILLSLPPLIDKGAEVYVKKGSTVHTKAFLVDEFFGWIGSYNLHPRGYRLECETIAAFLDKDLGKKLKRIFDNDANNLGTRINQSSDLVVPRSLMSEMGMAFFFNQL